MIAPLAQFSLPNRIELSQKYSSSRYLVTGFRVSGYPGLMCRKTVTGLRVYLLHRRMTAGSLNQTLYCPVIVKQEGLARLESSSLHLRGVEPIHCHLKITRPCLDSTYDSSDELPLPLTSTPTSTLTSPSSQHLPRQV